MGGQSNAGFLWIKSRQTACHRLRKALSLATVSFRTTVRPVSQALIASVVVPSSAASVVLLSPSFSLRASTFRISAANLFLSSFRRPENGLYFEDLLRCCRNEPPFSSLETAYGRSWWRSGILRKPPLAACLILCSVGKRRAIPQLAGFS